MMKIKNLQIESSKNIRFQVWKSLLKSSGIKEHQLFILSGEKLILEAKHKNQIKIQSEIRTSSMPTLNWAPESITLSAELFKELDIIGTHFPLIVVEMPCVQTLAHHQKTEGIEVVLPVGDPSNLGALIRSCVAFGVSKIILTQEAAHPFLTKSIKASAGAVLSAPLYFTGDLNEWDSSEAYALDLEGQDIRELKRTTNLRLIVGEEGPGLKNLKNLKKLKIPTQNVESLNVTVATSIALWELNRF
ncbi:MAG: TrmH family RNA methyltransferase [Bdellovibrionales bacterium]